MTRFYTIFIYKRVHLLFFLVFFPFFLFPPPSDAATVSLGIAPPVIHIEANPPASITTPITIENNGEGPVSLDILLKPFTASEKENGQVEYLTSTTQFTGANPKIFAYMQILENDHAIDSVTLDPGQEKTLKFHVGLLKDEVPSEYYFSIVFLLQERQEEVTESQTQSLGGVATNVLLSIGPKGKAKGVIEEFSSPWLQEKGPHPFTVRITNTSDHVIAPKGTILIRNMFGQLIGKVDLLPVNILSHTTRALPDSLQSPDATPPAAMLSLLEKTDTIVAVWPESFLLGPYTATLTIALSEEGPLFKKTIYFVGLPMQASIAFLVIISLLLLIYTRVKKRLR